MRTSIILNCLNYREEMGGENFRKTTDENLPLSSLVKKVAMLSLTCAVHNRYQAKCIVI